MARKSPSHVADRRRHGETSVEDAPRPGQLHPQPRLTRPSGSHDHTITEPKLPSPLRVSGPDHTSHPIPPPPGEP